MTTKGTSSGTALVTLPTDTQILITREFAAPKHLVFKAYTTSELIKRWWSSKRGAMKVAEIDLRVGGKWRFAMDADAGFEVAFHGEYCDVVPNERLVYTEVFEGVPDGENMPVLNTVTFTESDGRTTLTNLVEAPSREVRDIIIESGMEAGMQDGLDLLEEVAVSLM